MNINFKYYDQENIEHDGELIAAVTINGKRYILYETEEIKPEGDVNFVVVSEYYEIDNKPYIKEVDSSDIQFVREKLNQLIDSL